MGAKSRKWSPWSTPATRKFLVKVKRLKLELLDEYDVGHIDDEKQRVRIMAIKVKWKGESKFGLVPFHRSSKLRENFSSELILKNGEPIEWYNEFEDMCCLTLDSNDENFALWDVEFSILHGEKKKSKSKAKMTAIGKVSLNLGEIAAKAESKIETKLPLNLQFNGVLRKANLFVLVRFTETRVGDELPGLCRNSSEEKSANADKSGSDSSHSLSFGNSNESIVMCYNVEGSSELNDVRRIGSSPCSGFGPVKKMGFFPWKRRCLAFSPTIAKSKPIIKKPDNDVGSTRVGYDEVNGTSAEQTNTAPAPHKKLAADNEDSDGLDESTTWETKELISRDERTKLKAEVFFASFDQCSDKAAGESACTTLVAVIANWLHSNQGAMPTRSKFNGLIIDGSSEWRRLCNDEAYVSKFANKHFDLETVLNTDFFPIAISHERSYVGFFGAEKFNVLKEAMSFDQMWDEIEANAEDNTVFRTYIVSWNDHFFVLHAGNDDYYIIDTLGERLFEGCKQAFVLKFNQDSVMHEKKKTLKEKTSTDEITETGEEEEVEEEICTGKGCCREFMKRFLAAIPLEELEAEEEKNPVSYYSLHQRLQIEFNFTYSLSSSSLTSDSSSPSSSDAAAATISFKYPHF